MPFNEELYMKWLNRLKEDIAAHPEVCYWEKCEEERVEGSAYCGPHIMRDAIINHALFRRPGHGR